MTIAARLTLVVRRYQLARFTIRIAGIDLSARDVAMEVRLKADTPGEPLIRLNKVGTTAAEGIKVEVTTEGGVPVTYYKGRFNKATTSDAAKLPYAGEVGDPTPLEYGIVVAEGAGTIASGADAVERLYGELVVEASAFGSNSAPSDRPISYTATRLRAGGGNTASLTFGDQIVNVTIADAAINAALTQRSEIAADQAENAAATALAAGNYHPSLAAGEAATAADDAFSTDDGAGNLIIYRRTVGGSVEIARAVTPAFLNDFGFDVRFEGAAIDGVTDDSAAVAAANAAAGGRPLVFPGMVHVGSPVTITAPIADTMDQIFTTTSQVTIDNDQPVRPEWFGSTGAMDAAVNCLPQPKGGVVRLELGAYGPFDHEYGEVGAGRYLDRDNITIDGARMPRFADDCRSLTDGSIIRGFFLPYANGFQLRNVGIDSGDQVVDDYFGGVPVDALVISYPSEAMKAAGTLRRGVRLHNVITLCSSPSAPVHATIVGEGVIDVVSTGELTGCYGIHGGVIKCPEANIASMAFYANNTESVLVKSDAQATAIGYNVQIGRVTTNAAGPPGTTPYLSALGTQEYSLLIYASANNIDAVQIGMARLLGAKRSLATLFGGNYVIASVKIDDLFTDQGGVTVGEGDSRIGVKVADIGPDAGSIQRFAIGIAELRNTDVGVQAIFHAGVDIQESASIGHLTVVGAAAAVDIGNTAYLSIAALRVEHLTQGVYHITGTPSLTVGSLSRDSEVPAIYITDGGGLAPALAGTWNQVPDNDAFGVDLLGGMIHLRGLVAPGADNHVADLPPFAWPPHNKRFNCQGSTGAALTVVPVIVATNGGVYVNEIGGGTANCSSNLSLSGISYSTLVV